MILAYNTLANPLRIVLFDANDTKIAETERKNEKKARIDVPKEIWKLLQNAEIEPKKISKIIFCPGPGNFTPVRTASVIANAFATQIGAQLATFSSEENIEEVVVQKKYTLVKKAEPIFNAPPRIHISA